MEEEKITNEEVIAPDLSGEVEDAYKVIMGEYEGPLDLLLQLVKESKMDIEDVRLGDMTEQYLLRVRQMEVLDLEEVSGFIEIGATLMEIKSKYLLPTESVENEDGGQVIDEEEELRRRLREYQLFKEVGEDLHSIENVDHFYKEPDKSANDFRIVLKDMKLDAMLDAFANLLVRVEEKVASVEPKKIEMDRWTVAEKIEDIRAELEDVKHTKFSKLFDDDYSKSEVIICFLAMLELLKRQYIRIEQPSTFEEIDIYYNEDKVNSGETLEEEVSYN